MEEWEFCWPYPTAISEYAMSVSTESSLWINLSDTGDYVDVFMTVLAWF
jgi:hypothetical protein